MQIKPSDVADIQEIGDLEGEPVQLVRTTGGFHMAVGRRKGKKDSEILAAGSHAAIVKYNVEKQYKGFRPNLEKSEQETDMVTEHSTLLSKSAINEGFSLLSLEKPNKIEYIITKNNQEYTNFKAEIVGSKMVILSPTKLIKNEESHLTNSVALAAAQDAHKLGLSEIIHRNNVFKVKDLIK